MATLRMLESSGQAKEATAAAAASASASAMAGAAEYDGQRRPQLQRSPRALE